MSLDFREHLKNPILQAWANEAVRQINRESLLIRLISMRPLTRWERFKLWFRRLFRRP